MQPKTKYGHIGVLPSSLRGSPDDTMCKE